jgi:hypothetical protein
LAGQPCDVEATAHGIVVEVAPPSGRAVDPATPPLLRQWAERMPNFLDVQLRAREPVDAPVFVSAGGWQWTTHVTVDLRLRRPLRGAYINETTQPAWRMAELLRNLAGGPYFVFRATFAAPPAQAAAAASALVERWLEWFPREGWRLFGSWTDTDEHISDLRADG